MLEVLLLQPPGGRQADQEPYSELMIIDDWHRRGVTWPPWQAPFQRKYDTADLTRPLRLVKSGSNHAAYDLGREVAGEPGTNKDLSNSSLLCVHRQCLVQYRSVLSNAQTILLAGL